MRPIHKMIFLRNLTYVITVVRGSRVLKKGEYHLVVHIWVVDDKGRFLIQRRSDEKYLMSGEWAATGGAVMSGESSRHAAARELFEELGIWVDYKNLVLVDRHIRRFSINDIWAVKMNVAESSLKLQKEEVAEAKWVDRNTLKQMISDGEFHNYGADYFDTVFSIV